MKDHLPKSEQNAIEAKMREITEEWEAYFAEFQSINPAAAKDQDGIWRAWAVEEIAHLRVRLAALERRVPPASGS